MWYKVSQCPSFRYRMQWGWIVRFSPFNIVLSQQEAKQALSKLPLHSDGRGVWCVLNGVQSYHSSFLCLALVRERTSFEARRATASIFLSIQVHCTFPDGWVCAWSVCLFFTLLCTRQRGRGIQKVSTSYSWARWPLAVACEIQGHRWKGPAAPAGLG